MARGRITYNSVNIDFDNGWNEFDNQKMQRSFKDQMSGGITYQYNFYNQDFIQGRIEHLKPHQQTEVDSFYAYARDGSSFTLERDRELGTYINFKGWNATASNRLVTNDETAITFTRTNTTNATSYIDPSTGLLTFVNTANRARFPAGRWGQSGILIEPTRTNLVARRDFTNGDWVQLGSPTVTANTPETMDLEGTFTAFSFSGGASAFPLTSLTYTTGTAWTNDDGVFSIDMKARSDTETIRIAIGDSGTGQSEFSDVTVTTEWQRFEVNLDNGGAGGTGNWQVAVGKGQTEYIYMDNPQLEIGTNVLHATQRIRATGGSTLARPAEEIDEISSTDVINQTQGTIAFWFRPQWTYNEQPRSDLFYSYNTVGGTWRHLSLFALTNGDLEFRMDRANTSTQGAGGGFTLSSATKNTWNHVVATYDTTISNGLLTYLNGTLVDTSTNDPFVPCDIGSFSIGSSNGSNPASAVFDDFIIRKNVVDASWVNRVYNLGRGLGERRNRWSNVQLSDPNNSPKWKIGDRYDLVLRCEEVLT